jgi:outer membrane protein assembly factor BamA
MTYVNRAQRMNWGVGLFRLTEIYDDDLDEIRRERRVGVLGLASYPLSKFTRIEGQVIVRHASDHLLRSGVARDADLVSNYVAFVHDNSRWTEMGPSGGARLYLSAGATRDLSGGAGDFTSLLADLREYATPVPNLVFAARAQAQSSLGRDAQRFYLGGWSSIRGYDRRALSGVQTVLVQGETRFPLLRGLTLAVPALWTFPMVSGALFADAAWTWDTQGYGVLGLGGAAADVRAGSTGVSFYIGGGYYPALRWDWVWRTADFRHFERRPLPQFRMAYNF